MRKERGKQQYCRIFSVLSVLSVVKVLFQPKRIHYREMTAFRYFISDIHEVLLTKTL